MTLLIADCVLDYSCETEAFNYYYDELGYRAEWVGIIIRQWYLSNNERIELESKANRD